MRAAIISTWIAVAFDFIDKIQTLEAEGDTQAKKFAEEFRKIRQSSDLKGSLLFERQILDRAHKDLQLISDLEYADLSRLFEGSAPLRSSLDDYRRGTLPADCGTGTLPYEVCCQLHAFATTNQRKGSIESA